jgi:predicted TPR repeat methyltransferase
MGSAATPGNASDGAIGQAIEDHRAGRLALAEVAYQRILRREPSHPDALHFLGLVRFQQQDAAGGIEFVQRSLRAAPGNAHAWNNLGNMLASQDERQLAIEAYRKAIALLPTLAEAWRNTGVCLRRERQYEEAIRCFEKAIELRPDHLLPYEALGLLYYRLARVDAAADVYRRWLAVNPASAIARHMAAATSGEKVPERADAAYVAEVFDEFAGTFDSNLASLGYRAPQLLAAALGDHVNAQSGCLDVLDAGCGTGLCGPLLRSTARTLVGVDLSAGMIEKARQRTVYDELAVGELCAFMRTRAAAFDVVLSADTLCYFGALEDPIAAAHAALKPNGILAFTVESLEGAPSGTGEVPYRIEPHGRYAHAAAYLRDALAGAGFEVCSLEAVVLRRERGRDVAGHLVVGRLPVRTRTP